MIGQLKCRKCKNNFNPNEKPWKCKAFPNGIPEEKICYITHDPCIDCNNGIGFDSIYEAENEYRAAHKEEL